MNLLETDEVLALLKVSKTTLTALMRENHFPVPVILGKRKRRWREQEVLAWIASL